MGKEHEPKNGKAKGKASEYNGADPRIPEASQAVPGSRRSEATTGTRTEASASSQANSQSQARTTGQAGTIAQNSAAMTTTAHSRTLLPFWSRPHPHFGTAADPVDRFRRERRTWNPVGRPRRAPNWRDQQKSDAEDEQEDEKSRQKKDKGP